MSSLIKRSLPSLAFAALLAASAFLAVPAAAQKAPATPEKKAEVAKVPDTVQWHLAEAAKYTKKAAEYRAEAAAHRKMIQETVAKSPQMESPGEEPYVTKMRVHCEDFIDKAEALAKEADMFAAFHKARAAELQGK